MYSQTFPDDSLDAVERLYADQVCEHFPRYAELWEFFIGTREGTAMRLAPRELNLPDGWSAERIRQFEINREKVAMFHHSLFCDLAGAHYQIENARAALKKNDGNERYFEFFEAFDNFYGHVANAVNHCECLWNAVSKVVPTIDQWDKEDPHKEVEDTYRKLRTDVIDVRNTLVHYARIAVIGSEQGYEIPWPLPEEDARWSEYERERTKDAIVKMALDLELAEEFANEVDGVLIPALEQHLAKEGVEVA